MKNISIKRLVYFSAATAMIIVATAFLKLPVPITSGYVHLGDGIIFVAAALLGPWAALPASVGSAIADFIAGYPIYIPATFIIKGLMGFVAGIAVKKKSNILKNLLVFIFAEAIMVAGYFCYEIFLYGFSAALGAVLFNLVQAAAGIVMGMLFVPAAKRIKL